MRNDNFWDKRINGSIRERVAQFINKSPVLFKCMCDYGCLIEDEIVAFIEENRHVIASEVDKEYLRDDLIDQTSNDFDAEGVMAIRLMPVKEIDAVIDNWQCSLMSNDIYLDETWQTLHDTLEEVPCLSTLNDYDEDERVIYLAYLKEWYATHTSQSPMTIDEFFFNEMQDPEREEYFNKLAIKFRAENNL